MNKKGNVLIISLFLFFILILLTIFGICILYVQLHIQVYSVKNDLFVKSKSLVNYFDKEALAVYNYKVDSKDLKEKLNALMIKTHDNVNVRNVQYDKNSNCLIIYFEIRIKPVVFYSKIGFLNLEVKEKIKLKMMEYKDIET